MFGKRLEETPKSKCLELFFCVALFPPYWTWKFHCLGFLNFAFSTQWGCWLCRVPTHGSEIRKLPPAGSWGEDCRAHLMVFMPSGITVLAAWWPESAESCFMYFVLFSGCLQKKDTFYTGDFFIDQSLLLHTEQAQMLNHLSTGQAQMLNHLSIQDRVLWFNNKPSFDFNLRTEKPLAFFFPVHLIMTKKWLRCHSRWKAKQVRNNRNQMVNFTCRRDRKPAAREAVSLCRSWGAHCSPRAEQGTDAPASEWDSPGLSPSIPLSGCHNLRQFK